MNAMLRQMYVLHARYDVIDQLQASQLLSTSAASALRRMAAKDDRGLVRIYQRYAKASVKVLADRLLDLVSKDDL